MCKQRKICNSFATFQYKADVQPLPEKQSSLCVKISAITPAIPLLLLLSPAYIAEHDAIWYGISLDGLGSAVLAVSHPCCLALPVPYWQKSMRSWKHRGSVQALLCNKKNEHIVTTGFHHKSETQHLMRL